MVPDHPAVAAKGASGTRASPEATARESIIQPINRHLKFPFTYIHIVPAFQVDPSLGFFSKRRFFQQHPLPQSSSLNPTFSGPTDIKKKFPGLERRKFALPQKFVSLQSIDMEAQLQNEVKHGEKNKIGFFHLHHATEDPSTSDDEYSGGGIHSDTRFDYYEKCLEKGLIELISSDSTSSESDDGIVFPSGNDKRRPASRTKKLPLGSGLSDMERRRRAAHPVKRIRNSRSNPGLSNMPNIATLSGSERERNQIGGATSSQGQNNSGDNEGQSRPPIWCRSRSPKLPLPTNSQIVADTGRTVEQVCQDSRILHFSK